MLNNRLSLHLAKRETALKWLVIFSSFGALFSLLQNPLKFTISDIGRNHHTMLVFFCIFFSLSFLINLRYCLRAFDLKARLLHIIALFFNLGFGLVATTLMPCKQAGGEISLVATLVHWLFGFGGIIANATVALIICLKVSEKYKSKALKRVFVFGTAACILDLALFVLMTVIFRDTQKSKNGLYEIIPIAVTCLVLYFMNHTDMAKSRRERDEKELSLKAVHNDTLTAVSGGLLFSAWVFFSTYAFIRSPIHYTISMTGLEYFSGYAVCCCLLAAALVSNFILLFKRHRYKNYFIIIMSLLGSLSILGCVAKPTSLETNISPIHSICAVAFFTVTLACLVLFLLPKAKENRLYKSFAIIFALIFVLTIAACVLLFIVFEQKYGRTGLTEVIPLEAIFLFFYLESFKNTSKKPVSREAAKKVC